MQLGFMAAVLQLTPLWAKCVIWKISFARFRLPAGRAFASRRGELLFEI
jgi:hypothetical protein